MSDTLRDHVYRIRHHIFMDPLNRGHRMRLLWDYVNWQAVRKHGKEKWIIRFENGMRSYVHPYPDHDAGEMNIWTRNVDYHDTELVRRVLQKGDRIVDAGCNVGNRTWALADLIGGALMIDAGAAAIERVHENRALNGLSTSNFTTVHKAVGDHHGHVRFTDEGGAYTRNKVIEEGAPEPLVPLREVELTTIDAEVERLGWEPAYIKIDVEGQDLPAIRGAMKTLRSGCVRLVKFEHNASEPLLPLLSIFDTLGWKVFTLHKGQVTNAPKHLESEMNLFAAPLPIYSQLSAPA